ncbi:uncharacterized protein A1O5_07113 [Cladophialophora psammophila CBS 110553]|uniref:DUF7708 domain-containing protein n=1 Tax=Cladophialophora psammophila CBS 110553 TaxID=1182543 RepID=W9WYA5_9EURO|nr:uncharacterized protein A1O5_07113 [Cladophialophora psammophila CBS 110553]EXJ70040.1 hypothetical protein A1O5_07113 [Cladophialophora psammophila CBS 110553]
MSSQVRTPSTTSKRFSEKDLKIIECSENEQTRFKQIVATSKNFSGTEKNAVNIKSAAEFYAFWEETVEARKNFEDGHEKGCGLWSKNYQSAASVARSFMKDFSPIVEVVKNFAAPYGGMAIGTISVLLAVAASKNEMETSLASAISEINDRLPGLNLYRHIYNDNHELDIKLQGRIVAAYEIFIEFCIEATQYYKRSGFRRWFRALGSPSYLHEKVTETQKVILEIRRICDELLDKNIHLIKQLNLEQKATILRLEDEVNQLLKAQDNHILNEIQQHMNLSSFSSENHRKQLEQYRRALYDDDHLNAPFFEQMQGRRLQAFRACNEYQSWSNSKHSCLLILSGHNDSSIRYLDHCWLSPVAMTMITDLSNGDNKDRLYGYYVFSSRGESLYRAISVVLLQLLGEKSVVLRNKARCDELRAELSNLHQFEQVSQDRKVANNHNHHHETKKLSTFERVALRALDLFDESEQVQIILDRADRCCDLVKGVDHRKPLFKLLVKLVDVARCNLKVLAVVNGDQWDIEPRSDELGQRMEGRVIVHTAMQRMRD